MTGSEAGSMIRTAISIVEVWRPTVRTTDGLQVIVTTHPVKVQDQAGSLDLQIQMSFPMPVQDEHRPQLMEDYVYEAGLQVQHAMFWAVMQSADTPLVFARRAGKDGQGIQLRGTLPYSLKTRFGTVSIERTRFRHRVDGGTKIPAKTAWKMGHHEELTRGLRVAISGELLHDSTGLSRSDVCHSAGEDGLVCRTTLWNVVQEEGSGLIEAVLRRTRDELEQIRQARQVLLPGVAESETAEAEAAAEQVVAAVDVPPEVLEPVGWAGGPGVAKVNRDEPRQADAGHGVVQLDEVKTKAQPHTDRKEVWMFTAVVLMAGGRYVLVDATKEGRFEQLAAVLHRLEVNEGLRRLLVIADGARWIRGWFEGLSVPCKAMS
jgi:hypothetical protein